MLSFTSSPKRGASDAEEPQKTAHETELIRRAQQGDRAALESLLESVWASVYRFSLNMCGADDAEDALQETLLTASEKLEDFRGASSFSTWLYAIARSVCTRRNRRSKFAPKHHQDTTKLELTAPTSSPETVAEAKEHWRSVRRALSRMEQANREVIMLRDVEGLSAKEVAEVVGVSVSAVKSRLHRARAELRRFLEERPYEAKPGCPDIRREFSRHLEGELDQSICSTLERHVASCDACRRECDELQLALVACASAETEVPPEVQARVREAIKSRF